MHARIQKFSRGWGGGGGVQIPRKGLTENFSMAKINNLAIPGGGGPDPLPPPPFGSAHDHVTSYLSDVMLFINDRGMKEN